MRLKRSRVKQYHARARITKKDNEGGTYEEYDAAVSFDGEAWPAGGKVQAETYGERLSYIRNVKIQGEYVIMPDRDNVIHYVYPDGLDIVENDGLCLYVQPESPPDYKVISIKPYAPLRLEAERI